MEQRPLLTKATARKGNAGMIVNKQLATSAARRESDPIQERTVIGSATQWRLNKLTDIGNCDLQVLQNAFAKRVHEIPVVILSGKGVERRVTAEGRLCIEPGGRCLIAREPEQLPSGYSSCEPAVPGLTATGGSEGGRLGLELMSMRRFEIAGERAASQNWKASVRVEGLYKDKDNGVMYHISDWVKAVCEGTLPAPPDLHQGLEAASPSPAPTDAMGPRAAAAACVAAAAGAPGSALPPTQQQGLRQEQHRKRAWQDSAEGEPVQRRKLMLKLKPAVEDQAIGGECSGGGGKLDPTLVFPVAAAVPPNAVPHVGSGADAADFSPAVVVAATSTAGRGDSVSICASDSPQHGGEGWLCGQASHGGQPNGSQAQQLEEALGRNKDLERQNKELKQQKKELEQRNKDLERQNKDLKRRNKDAEKQKKEEEQRNRALERRNKEAEKLHRREKGDMTQEWKEEKRKLKLKLQQAEEAQKEAIANFTAGLHKLKQPRGAR